MLEKAILKIKSEMGQNENNSYVQVVGSFLLQYLNGNPASSENILQESKTILKSLDEMRKEAEKKKVGSCAVLTDQEGFAVVLKYFGINDKLEKTEYKAPETKTTSNNHFDVNLDDLLQ